MGIEIFSGSTYNTPSNDALKFIKSQIKRLFLWIIVLIWSTSCDKNVQAQEDLPKSGDVYVAGRRVGRFAILLKNDIVQNISTRYCRECCKR